MKGNGYRREEVSKLFESGIDRVVLLEEILEIFDCEEERGGLESKRCPSFEIVRGIRVVFNVVWKEFWKFLATKDGEET